MKATKCPVCEGTGKYKEKECHGCDGKGWVSVSGDYPIYPIYPYPCDPYPDYPYRWTITPTITWGDDTASVSC